MRRFRGGTQVTDEPQPPADVTDLRLWRDAQKVLRRHRQGDFPNERGCAFCHEPWPCQPRLWADRADRIARRPPEGGWHGDEPRYQRRPG